ncbi:uncharacterized protein PV09_09366 [Verruconis gallopava]|uniref:Uncharacterized protein n=1 Tax=Verruconis gallopava TaxID=253628 RepID=A0A0D1ZWK1_9PEZI|nr:uncharacterized protein PV09_09366 [Verruconis gallopava]KIV98872.1 hypothetical protein PV09_09366 [Verruconis gallopava]
MGAEISTLVRTRLEHQNLDELLDDNQLMAECHRKVQELSANTRQNLQCLFAPLDARQKSKKSANRLDSLQRIRKDDIKLPADVASLFETWKNQPAIFTSYGHLTTPMEPGEHYRYALTVRTSISSRKILWRFVATIYHKLVSALHKSKRFSTRSEVMDFLVASIHRSSGSPPDEIRENIMAWAKEGSKYWCIALKLGCIGCYFYLPEVAESIWWKYLKKDNAEQLAELLSEYGILEKTKETGAARLAHDVEHLLLMPFWSEVIIPANTQRALPPHLRDGGAARPDERVKLAAVFDPPRWIQRCCDDQHLDQQHNQERNIHLPMQLTDQNSSHGNNEISMIDVSFAQSNHVAWPEAEVLMLKARAWESLNRIIPQCLNLSIFRDTNLQPKLTVWLDRDFASWMALPQNDCVLPIPSRHPAASDQNSDVPQFPIQASQGVALTPRLDYCLDLALWSWIVSLRLKNCTLTVPRSTYGPAFCTIPLDYNVAESLAENGILTSGASFSDVVPVT